MLQTCLSPPPAISRRSTPCNIAPSNRSLHSTALCRCSHGRIACRANRVPASYSNEVDYSSNPFAAALAGVVLLSSAGPAAANIAVLEGPARVVDGDTLYIGQEKIRLYAVDAPEKTQTCNNSKGQPYQCGVVSLNALKDRVSNHPVRCEVRMKDQYGRNVAACSVIEGRLSEDMGSWLVSNGYAVAYKQYGKDYIIDEEKAHAKRLGIWQGNFTEPSLWRKQQKGILPSAPPLVDSSSMDPLAAAASTTGIGLPIAATAVVGQQAPVAAVSNSNLNFSSKCNGAVIKGNINSRGEKIYHTITSGSYNRVQIDESAGERYFCTEQEAKAAGWRSALR